MPIYKYKSLNDAEKALWHLVVDETYLIKLREFYNLISGIRTKMTITKGIRKFKTLEEADKKRFEETIISASENPPVIDKSNY